MPSLVEMVKSAEKAFFEKRCITPIEKHVAHNIAVRGYSHNKLRQRLKKAYDERRRNLKLLGLPLDTPKMSRSDRARKASNIRWAKHNARKLREAAQ